MRAPLLRCGRLQVRSRTTLDSNYAISHPVQINPDSDQTSDPISRLIQINSDSDCTCAPISHSIQMYSFSSIAVALTPGLSNHRRCSLTASTLPYYTRFKIIQIQTERQIPSHTLFKLSQTQTECAPISHSVQIISVSCIDVSLTPGLSNHRCCSLTAARQILSHT